jgi:hypothetical protein
MPSFILAYFNWLIFILCVVGVVVVIQQLISRVSAPPGTGMAGMWTTVGVTGYQGAKR